LNITTQNGNIVIKELKKTFKELNLIVTFTKTITVIVAKIITLCFTFAGEHMVGALLPP
jgi:hypothetical protein